MSKGTVLHTKPSPLSLLHIGLGGSLGRLGGHEPAGRRLLHPPGKDLGSLVEGVELLPEPDQRVLLGGGQGPARPEGNQEIHQVVHLLHSRDGPQ